MPTLTPTKDTGATTKAVHGVYAEPDRQVTDEQLADSLDLPDGLNAAFVADLLSGMLAHERCGRHLYRSVAGRTRNPVLQAKYEEFGEETEHHAEVLENLISRLGGNPQYVSPTARVVEGADTHMLQATFLLSGSIDMMNQEMAMLDAVFLAESMDHANWELLGKLSRDMPDGDARRAVADAVAEVEPDEDEHLEWARQMKARMVELQATSALAASAMMKTEEMVATVKSWFSD